MTTTHTRRRRALPPAVETLTAAAALALVMWGAHQLHIRSGPAAVVSFCLVVLVALRGRMVPALAVAVGATVVWGYFFSGAEVTFAERQLRVVAALVAFCATAVMITRLVAALRTSEGRWRNVFENNPTMYFMVDRSGTILAVNAAGVEQLGYGAPELVGRSVLTLFVEDDRAAARDQVARCLTRLGESLSWELRKVRKDGTMLWVRETARAVQLGSEPPVVLIACEDITTSKEAQEAVRENDARLRGQASLLDLTHDAIFVRDPNDVIVYWNRGAAEQYGWSRAEAAGQVTHQLLKTVFPEPLEAINATLERTGRWDGELVHTKRDGARIVVASRWSLQRDDQRRPASVMETNNDVTERKRAEGELRRSETYLAEAQRLSHTGSFGWNQSDGTITWSDETYRIFGFGRDVRPNAELILQRTHPEDRAGLQAGMEHAQQQRTDFELEHRLLMPDGSTKHVRVVAQAVTDGSGVSEFVGAVMDVTAQRMAEEERRARRWFLESMDRVNRAMQGTNDIEQVMSDVLDVTLSTFDCDRVALAFPCDPDATSVRVVMARTRPEFPSPHARSPEGVPVSDEHARMFRALRASPGPVRIDPGTMPDFTTKTGARSVLGMAIYPKVDEPYLLVLVQCSYARVWTEREEQLFQEIGRRLGDALTTLLVLRDLGESARRYRNIFQMADVSIWEEDFSQLKLAVEDLRASGVSDFRRYFAEHPEFVARAVQLVRVIDVNDATLRLFSAADKNELLVSLPKVFTPETLEVFVGELLAVAEGRTSFAAETVLQTLRGERLDVAFTIAFPPPPTNFESVLVSIMDVTARKRAEDAMHRAQAELARVGTLTTMGQLAASIAHELRQPLAAIVTNGSAALRWLNREQPDVGEARDAAVRIVHDAHRADEVIQGLRALVGQSALERAPVDMNDAIHQVLELARGELRRSDVSVRTDLAPMLPPALGDRVQLQQVLLNLIVNAIEAMAPVIDRPKALVIRTARTETEEVAVVVEDTGPGLDPATAERVFDPFFTTKRHGLGMGLSICRSIVETHGGQLSASLRSPHGTTFRFTIPTTAQAGSPPAPIDRSRASVAALPAPPPRA